MTLLQLLKKSVKKENDKKQGTEPVFQVLFEQAPFMNKERCRQIDLLFDAAKKKDLKSRS